MKGDYLKGNGKKKMKRKSLVVFISLFLTALLLGGGGLGGQKAMAYKFSPRAAEFVSRSIIGKMNLSNSI